MTIFPLAQRYIFCASCWEIRGLSPTNSDGEVADAEYESLGAKYLRDWLDPRLTLGDLRVAWLNKKLFTEEGK